MHHSAVFCNFKTQDVKKYNISMQSVFTAFILTKHAMNIMITGTATMTRRYRQPTVGIMSIEADTTNDAPNAQNI